jgi:hypothetical protein
LRAHAPARHPAQYRRSRRCPNARATPRNMRQSAITAKRSVGVFARWSSAARPFWTRTLCPHATTAVRARRKGCHSTGSAFLGLGHLSLALFTAMIRRAVHQMTGTITDRVILLVLLRVLVLWGKRI